MSTAIQTLKRNAYGFAALLFLMVAMLPSIIAPQLASAAEQMTERSIQMSDAAPAKTGVTYNVTFKPATSISAKAFVVDFCTSPIIGTACTKPSGSFAVPTTPTSSVLTSGWTLAGANSNRTFTATNSAGSVTLTAGTPYSFDISGITNPNVGTFFARIYTYTATAGASSFPSDGVNSDAGAAASDAGSVALSATNNVDVTATVQESLTFCVAAVSISANCANAAANPPNIKLGEGNPAVLDSSVVSKSSVYFQVTSNAANGTTVRMKGASANLMSGSKSIPAVGSGTSVSPVAIAAGTAAFGVRATTVNGGADGTMTADSTYNSASDYNMFAADVTGTYGDIIAASTAPTRNVTVPMEFAATAGATTSAGVYTAVFSLIATGSY